MVKKENNGKSRKNDISNVEINQALLENFITLQKVLTNLSVKFEDMSGNIEKLLQLFEISAKSFAEKSSESVKESDKEFLAKLDNLLDQNKTISKGIMMMEERIRQRTTPQFIHREEPRFRQSPQPKILPRQNI